MNPNDKKFLELLGTPLDITAIRNGDLAGRKYDTAAEFAEGETDANAKGWNIYYHANQLWREPYKDGKVKHSRRASKPDIGRWRCIVIDLDPPNRSDEDGAATFRAKVIERIASFDRQPTAVIDSGGGIQLVWIFKNPENLQVNGKDSEPSEKLIKVCEGKSRRLGVEVVVHVGAGVVADSTNSIDHLFRAPGFINHKNGRVAHVIGEIGPLWDSVDFPVEELVPQSCEAASVAVNIDDVKLVKSVDDLDVSDRTKVIVKMGFDPEDPKDGDTVDKNGKITQPDRSHWVFDALCQLCREGVPDEVICGLMMNPNFRISESVLEKPFSWLARRLKEAHGAVGVVVAKPRLHPSMPLNSARAYQNQREPVILWGKDWMTFNGVIYRTTEEGSIHAELYHFLEKCLQVSPDGKMDKDKPFNPDKAKVSNVMDALKALVHTAYQELTPPCWIRNMQNPATELVAVDNGLLHLPSKTLLQGNPDLFMTHSRDYAYNPEALCPNWLKFQRETWGEDDPGALLCAQEWAGYLLTADNSLQKALILIGKPRAGKGVFCNTCEALAGPTAWPNSSSLNGDFGLEVLEGKLLTIFDDMRLDKRTRKLVELLLSIIGGSPKNMNRKGKVEIVVKLLTRFMFTSNHMPELDDPTGTIASRFILLNARFSKLGHEDRHLWEEKLLPEMSGILNWAIEGWQRLQEQGHFTESAFIDTARIEMEEGTSPVQVFVNNCCNAGVGKVATKEGLWIAYMFWCRDTNNVLGNRQTFLKDLGNLMTLELKERQITLENDKRERCFEGIELKETEGCLKE